MLKAECIHLLTPAEKLGSDVEALIRLRQDIGLKKPFILWESPRLTCIAKNLKHYMAAVKHVDVWSPIHTELLSLFDREPEFNKKETETLAGRFLDEGVGSASKGYVLVRAGEHGCVVVWGTTTRQSVWLPPFYDPEHDPDNSPVIDPTGAGNAFLGGFAVGWSETRNAVEAAAYGNVASSFMLEQIGPPKATDMDGELWNGVSPRARLQEYQAKLWR